MASRGPSGPRGSNNRFAQFKLVLLGESAVGKVDEHEPFFALLMLTHYLLELHCSPFRKGSIRLLP
jgi:hypothetical protein